MHSGIVGDIVRVHHATLGKVWMGDEDMVSLVLGKPSTKAHRYGTFKLSTHSLGKVRGVVGIGLSGPEVPRGTDLMATQPRKSVLLGVLVLVVLVLGVVVYPRLASLGTQVDEVLIKGLEVRINRTPAFSAGTLSSGVLRRIRLRRVCIARTFLIPRTRARATKGASTSATPLTVMLGP